MFDPLVVLAVSLVLLIAAASPTLERQSSYESGCWDAAFGADESSADSSACGPASDDATALVMDSD